MSEDIDYSISGNLLYQARALNGRLFARLFSQHPDALITSDQSKIMWCLWKNDRMTTTDLSIATGYAKNTLSVMLDKLEKKKLIAKQDHPTDKRKKYYVCTELGLSQKHISKQVSDAVGQIFYAGFTEEERQQLESLLVRVIANLKEAK